MTDIISILPLLQEGGGSSQLLTMILPFGLIIGVFYFLIIRPQNKKQKETKQMLSAIKKNDRVVTVGGIRGTVTAVKEDTVVLRVDDSVKMEFSKSAVSNIVTAKGSAGGSKGSSKSSDSESGNDKDANKDANKEGESKSAE